MLWADGQNDECLMSVLGSNTVITPADPIIFQSAGPDCFVPHGDLAFVDDPDSFAALTIALDEDERLNPMRRLFERPCKLPQVTIGKLAGYARGGGAEC